MKNVEIMRKGYADRSRLLDNGEYPTQRADKSYDVHLYACVAATALDINDTNRRQWIDAYKSGWQQRDDDYIVTQGGEIIQRFGGFEPDEFGVITHNSQLAERLIQLGARKEPAHYGFSALSERYYLKSSYILPISIYDTVYTMLLPVEDKMTILRNHLAELAKTSKDESQGYAAILEAIKDCKTKKEAIQVLESMTTQNLPITIALEAIDELGELSPALKWVDE